MVFSCQSTMEVFLAQFATSIPSFMNGLVILGNIFDLMKLAWSQRTTKVKRYAGPEEKVVFLKSRNFFSIL